MYVSYVSKHLLWVRSRAHSIVYMYMGNWKASFKENISIKVPMYLTLCNLYKYLYVGTYVVDYMRLYTIHKQHIRHDDGAKQRDDLYIYTRFWTINVNWTMYGTYVLSTYTCKYYLHSRKIWILIEPPGTIFEYMLLMLIIQLRDLTLSFQLWLGQICIIFLYMNRDTSPKH